ncbi:hypothetical protein [Streptomyces sp. NPDC057740]|uniref:hypothetical protein n=1 Tax=Streptomyces sp. NPDC057740 TaxID=3346234 RepID=UPI0036CC565E
MGAMNWRGVRKRVEALARGDKTREVFGAWDMYGGGGTTSGLLVRSQRAWTHDPVPQVGFVGWYLDWGEETEAVVRRGRWGPGP